MTPIRELLNRIRWDPAFGQARFAIGYYDRVAREIVKVPFREILFDPSDHYFFQVADDSGEVHSIPFHRVKEVYRNDVLIWHRER